MNQEQIYLNCILRRVICGQYRIQMILGTAIRTQLRRTLLLQRKEYSMIEAQIRAFASSKGWQLRAMDPVVLFLSSRFLKIRLGMRRSDVHAASYMIHSCTQGMIDCLSILHRCTRHTAAIRGFVQKLLDCERSCILQLQGFL